MILLALTAVLAAPPSETVQTLDLAALSWPRALALHGRPVRVRFLPGRNRSRWSPTRGPR